MSATFVHILRQAIKTFDRTNQTAFNSNFRVLKQLTEQLTYRDIHLSQEDLLNDAVFAKPDSAPCTYVPIFENDIVSMSVFVLRGGYTMPLHDHPMMYGLLRCIYGKLRVQSYTQKFADNDPLYDPAARELRVVPEPERILGPSSESAVLSPREANLHEITALEGVAAFFDILSPPYEVFIPEYGTRRCRFYHKTVLQDPSEVPALRLERIPAPLTYHCDTAETPQTVKASVRTFVHLAKTYSEL